MAVSSPDERKWLVKSSGAILGPFSFNEIASYIKSKKVALIDEIRTPDSRWMFIREHKQFAEIVQQVRDQMANSKEDTGSTFSGKTQTITHSQDEEITRIPASYNRNEASAHSASGWQMDSSSGASQTVPTYGSSADIQIKRKIAHSEKRYALVAWLGLILILVGIAAYQLFSGKPVVRSYSYENYIQMAQSARDSGKLDEALEYFRKAESIRFLENDHRIQMAPLLMAVDNQNVQARQILEGSVKNKNMDPKTYHEIESLIALSYLREGRLDEAYRRYAELLKADPKNRIARVNLVTTLVLQTEFKAAMDRLTEMLKSGVNDPFVFMLRLLVSYRLNEDAAKLESAKADLKRMISQYQDYKPEMLLLLAAFQKKQNREQEVTETLTALLKINPDLTASHNHDFRIHREVVEWAYLANICDLIVQKSPAYPVYQGLEAFCSYQQKDIGSALEKIEKARTQHANDTLLAAQHAFYLYRAGRIPEANALLQLPKVMDQPLASFVKASICMDSSEWKCAEDSWRKVQKDDPKNLAAFAGLSRIALARGQEDLASDYLKQGVLLSGAYKPYLQLKEKLDEN